MFCHPTFDVLPPLLQVFLEAESVLVAEPEVFALVFVVAGLSPEAVVLVAEPVLVVVSQPVLVVEPELLAAGPVFDVAEPQVSVDIAVVFVVLVPVSVVAVEVDSSGRPKFFAFPNICSFPNCSSSVEVVG